MNNDSDRINRTDWLKHVGAYLKKSHMSKAQIVRNSKKLPKPYQLAKSYVYHQVSTSPRERINPTKRTCYKVGMALGMPIGKARKWVSTMKPALSSKLPKATKRGVTAKKSETAKVSHKRPSLRSYSVKTPNKATHESNISNNMTTNIDLRKAMLKKSSINDVNTRKPRVNHNRNTNSVDLKAREGLYGKYVHVLMSRNHINKKELMTKNTFGMATVKNFVRGRFSKIPAMDVAILLKELNTNKREFIHNAYLNATEPSNNNRHVHPINRPESHHYNPVRHNMYKRYFRDNTVTNRAVGDIKKLGDGDTQIIDSVISRIIQGNYAKHDIAELQNKYMNLKSTFRIYKINYDNLKGKYRNLKKSIQNVQFNNRR